MSLLTHTHIAIYIYIKPFATLVHLRLYLASHLHTYIVTHLQPYIHAYIHTDIPSYIHSYIHLCIPFIPSTLKYIRSYRQTELYF